MLWPSDFLSTVSPTYLKETLCSGWLAGTLIRHCDKYFAILNGIDTGVWNPTTDAFFPAKFDDTDMFGGCFKLQAPVSNALSSSRSESALKVAAVAKMVTMGDCQGKFNAV
ncbi:hypothetical protein ACS0TY_023971 [Phlomoides rotata]